MTAPPRILQLTPTTTSRIRSTQTIPTLPSAIQALLRNSLDASATSLTLTLDPSSRPSFTLTDNGVGIAPCDLHLVARGGYSSKPSPPAHGEAIAAIAAHAVVTVVSRGRQARWCYGEEVFVGPASGEWFSGTVVRVEGLWGDVPVRIRAREGVDMEREWREVLSGVVALLVAGKVRGVGFVARDASGAKKMVLKPGGGDLDVLRAAFGAVVGGKEEWESVKARQSGVRVEGWVSVGRRGGGRFLGVNGVPVERGGELERAVTERLAGRPAMYVLRVEYGEPREEVEGEDLRRVIQLLKRLVDEFLRAHHYSPPLGTAKRKREATPQEDRAQTPQGKRDITPLKEKEIPRLMHLDNCSRVKAARHDEKEVTGRCSTGGKPKRKADPTPAARETTPLEATSDEATIWKDPTSGKPFLVNTRTGNTTAIQKPAIQKPAIQKPAIQDPTIHKRSSTTPSCRHPTPSHAHATTTPAPGTFLATLLSTWRNPVFPLAPSSPASLPSPPPYQRITKLSKLSLQAATVIAQVDAKYILLRLPASPTSPHLMAILDQHAASERIRVEELFRELSTPATSAPLTKPLLLNMSTEELGLLQRFRGEFARWGIQYEVHEGQVEITALPRVARDRPETVEEMVRKHCWDLAERGSGVGWEGGDWVSTLDRVPEVLREVVNSRACRGAIMFNDVLTMEECRGLVERLAGCKWPFMCAHGRVGMQPLVEIGDFGVRRAWERKMGGFREDMQRWRQRVKDVG